MRKIIKYLTILPMILLLVGCGGEDPVPEGNIQKDIVGKTITQGDYTFKFDRIITVPNVRGEPNMFFKIEFTNNSDETVRPFNVFYENFEAFQYDDKKPIELMQALPKNIPAENENVVFNSANGEVPPHTTETIIEGFEIKNPTKVLYLTDYTLNDDKPTFIYEIPSYNDN